MWTSTPQKMNKWVNDYMKQRFEEIPKLAEAIGKGSDRNMSK